MLLTGSQMADRLVRIFLETVNPSWPVVEEGSFRRTYLAFKADRAFGAGGWEAQLYTVMAITVRHVQLLQKGECVAHVSPDTFFRRCEVLRQEAGYVPTLGTVIELQTLLLSLLHLGSYQVSCSVCVVPFRVRRDYVDFVSSAICVIDRVWPCLLSLSNPQSSASNEIAPNAQLSHLYRMTITLTQCWRRWSAALRIPPIRPAASSSPSNNGPLHRGQPSPRNVLQFQVLQLKNYYLSLDVVATLNPQSFRGSPFQASPSVIVCL
jgi:hypothetical protein